MRVITAFEYNLTNLLNFRGRENRAQFWPYVGLVIALSFLALAMVMLPAISATMIRMQRFATEHPELATVEQGPGTYSITIRGYHPELMPDVGHAMLTMAPVLIVTVSLIAGAIARRLHDRGKSALWGLAPFPFLLVAALAFPTLFQQNPTNMAAFLPLFFALFLNNALYLAALAYLFVLLIGDGTPSENRFGPPPTS